MPRRFSILAPPWLLLAALAAVFVSSGQAQQVASEPSDTAISDGALTAQDRNQQDQPDQQNQADVEPQLVPVFRSGINFIRVDAIVTDGDGNHVSDLEASDFEVYENGELQTVETFDRVEISGPPQQGERPPAQIVNRSDEEREAARGDVRIFVIFFDDYHVRFGNGHRVSLAITEFLRNNLLPTDLVAVMYPLSPVTELRLTRDHDMVIKEVESFMGRKYQYDPRNMFEQEYETYPTEAKEQIRNEVSLTALSGLMVHLGGLSERRKSVLLVSEGYTNYVPPQLRNIGMEFNPAALDSNAAESSYEQTRQIFRDSGITLRIRELFQAANRFNTSIYSLDPRGLAVGEYDMSQPSIARSTDRNAVQRTQNTLHVLSEQSDGRAIVNRNDLRPGLEQMMRDSSAYYLLGYTSSQSPSDGRFHKIEVRVKRADTEVRSRKGFWALTERDVERALTSRLEEPPKAVEVALSALAEPRRGYLVRTWFGTSRGENGWTRITFVWEPTSGQSGGEDAARVLLTAIGVAGGAFYRGRVPELSGMSGRGLVSSAGGSETQLTSTTFEAEPGVMQISVAVESENGEVLDRDFKEVDVPDFAISGVVLSTPAFVRARSNLEWKNLVDNWDAIPTASREFRRTERLLIRFEAYASGTTIPNVEAWLLNRGGDKMYPLIVQQAKGGHSHQVDIQPAGLPPGEYVVELRATTSDDETTHLVAFRLRS